MGDGNTPGGSVDSRCVVAFSQAHVASIDAHAGSLKAAAGILWVPVLMVGVVTWNLPVVFVAAATATYLTVKWLRPNYGRLRAEQSFWSQVLSAAQDGTLPDRALLWVAAHAEADTAESIEMEKPDEASVCLAVARSAYDVLAGRPGTPCAEMARVGYNRVVGVGADPEAETKLADHGITRDNILSVSS